MRMYLQQVYTCETHSAYKSGIGPHAMGCLSMRTSCDHCSHCAVCASMAELWGAPELSAHFGAGLHLAHTDGCQLVVEGHGIILGILQDHDR